MNKLNIKKGDSVLVLTGSSKGKIGKVGDIDSSGYGNKATVKVRIALLEKDERVLPDMGSRVSFLRKVETKMEETPKEGVMIPLAAISVSKDQSFVQALKENKIIITNIEIAEETANYARVTKGLKSGMKVIARFDDDLEDNQKVIVK